MSSDLESSNPFETLSDDPILHIFSYLPGAALLHLSKMDKTFKRIITESTETMSKIRLVLDFYTHKDLDLDFAIKLAQTRQFTALRLKHVHKLTDANTKVKLVSLLDMLSGSVADLIVEGYISRELLSSIIASFLPKLKKCKLEVMIKDDADLIIEEVSSQSSVNHPLQFLELINTHADEVLHFFACCNQLKTFCYNEDGEHWNTDDIRMEHVNNLLAKQHHLEKLEYYSTTSSAWLAWNRLRCFKLKELKALWSPATDHEHAAAKFLKKLPKLRQLDIGFFNYPSGSLMTAISEIPTLEKLTIRSSLGDDDEEYDEAHEILVNHTVKILEIHDDTGITSQLLTIFLGIESVYLKGRNNTLDLSVVPPEKIRKIKLSEDCPKDFFVKFRPIDIPNVELFQSAVMMFAKSFAKFIAVIRIGHVSWRNSGEFRVSNTFCENLVNQLPELRELEIYNVADRGRFIAFLDDNQARLNLEEVRLHEPFGPKMKIRSD